MKADRAETCGLGRVRSARVYTEPVVLGGLRNAALAVGGPGSTGNCREAVAFSRAFCGDRKWRARGMGSRVDRTDHVRRPGKAALGEPLSRRKREALRLAGSFTDALFFRGRRVGRAAVPHVASVFAAF